MAQVVYVLCAMTSVMCAALLLRGFRSSRVRLLLWSGLCFLVLAFENVVLFADLVLLPQVDLTLVRNFLGLVGPTILLFGLIAEAE